MESHDGELDIKQLKAVLTAFIASLVHTSVLLRLMTFKIFISNVHNVVT